MAAVPISEMPSTAMELAVVGASICFCVSLISAWIRKNLEKSWALSLSAGFALHALTYATIAFNGGVIKNSLQLLFLVVVISTGYAVISVGIWQYPNNGNTLKDRQLMATLFYIVVVAFLYIAKVLNPSASPFTSSIVWMSWLIHFMKGRDYREASFVNAVACLIYPLFAILGAANILPPTLSKMPGMVPIAAFGLTFLATSLQQAHRQATLAEVEIARELVLRVNAEAKVRLLNDRLEHLVEERTQALRETIEGLESFNRSVSHDLRGPLGGISAMLPIARDRYLEGDTTRGTQILDAIAKQSKELYRLVEGLLALARAASGAVQRHEININDLANEVFDEICTENQLTPPRLVMTELPSANADKLLVKQLFRNLLSNAIKFTKHQNNPLIEIGHIVQKEEVVYFVKDNGVGFAPQDADRMFQPFERLHSNKFEGTGIGLNIVRRVVMAHNGWIKADGAPGSHAAFFFTLQGKPTGTPVYRSDPIGRSGAAKQV